MKAAATPAARRKVEGARLRESLAGKPRLLPSISRQLQPLGTLDITLPSPSLRSLVGTSSHPCTPPGKPNDGRQRLEGKRRRARRDLVVVVLGYAVFSWPARAGADDRGPTHSGLRGD
jgi:hypothetical protein